MAPNPDDTTQDAAAANPNPHAETAAVHAGMADGNDEERRARAASGTGTDEDAEAARDRATAGGPQISVQTQNGARQVFGRGFAPNTTLEIRIGGVRYAGQRTEDDGTFRRAVPLGDGRIEFVTADGKVAAADGGD